MNAVTFQNMPPLSPEEYAALEQSIRANGIQVPIVVDENGTVIDGHHRQKIAEDLDIDCPQRVVTDRTETEKRTLALSLNLDRRHLTREQRRGLIAESLKADPQLSDREHGRRTGADHKTVAAIRPGLEANGEIPQSPDRITGDGKPAPGPKPGATKLTETTKTETWIDSTTGEVLDEPNPRPDPKVAAAEQQAPKPRRRPLPDAARDAGWDLRRAVERLERITADDRFATNREQVADMLRDHLLNTVKACQGLLDQINQ